MLYSTLVSTMGELSDTKERFVLPQSIIPEALEMEYMNTFGSPIQAETLGTHSVIYTVGSARFYHGAITRHPSTSCLKLVG